MAACRAPQVADPARARPEIAANQALLVKQQIEASLQRTTSATLAKDVDAYMAEMPTEFAIHEDSGPVTARAQQRENILRDWSIITETIALTNVVDSIQVHGDVAQVHTSQRWERRMLRPDGQATDHVVTTQKHRETWRLTPRGWLAFKIEELGGEILINGQPYEP